MSDYNIEAALHRLRDLGVDTSNLHQDYYKIPLENIDLKNTELPEPKKEKQTSKHTIIIDSRQRDYTIYPTPSEYLINLMEPHRSVEQIELIAVALPKTEYNVNSENNLIVLTIGGITEYITLNVGQYLIGTNVLGSSYISNGSPVIFGLLAEIIRALNTHSLSGNGFNAFLATLPPANNASVLNRIVITNSAVSFTIDFTNNTKSSGSPYQLWGFFKRVYQSNLGTWYGTDDLGTCTPGDLQSQTTFTSTIQSIVADFDYNLLDDPSFIIMNLEFGNRSADRVESVDISTNQKFAVIIYDANEPDNIETYPTSNANVQYASIRRPGRMKPLKGSDFDKKIIVFEPGITLENFKITFSKYDNTLYNFNNREHLLTFELTVADYDPKYRY